MTLPVLQPSRVTVMIKPVGALCNLDCTYCYYLPTKTVYDGREHRMSLRTLEELFAGLIPHMSDEMMIAWQGGEPTLAGLEFFKKAVEYQKKYARPGQVITHSLQTNGTLLDDAWCRFFNEHNFLIGLSLDGPAKFHDHYRVTNRGQASSRQVLRGLKLLQQHKVQFNLLCVLNDINVRHPDEMVDYLLSLGTRWFQFIPAVEWVKEDDPVTGGPRNVLAPYSPPPVEYGRFLCRVFDRWFEELRHRISVRIFDAVLNKMVLNVMPFCILDGECHNQLTVEHDGAVFGCDHFIERRWQLARIGDTGWGNALDISGGERVGLTVHGTGYEKAAHHVGRDIDTGGDVPLAEAPAAAEFDTQWLERVDTHRLGAFAARKQHLPEKCRQCRWKPFCHGGCPKHRSQGGEVPEPTVLCEAYMMFYAHAMPRLEWLAGFLRHNRQPPPPARASTLKKRVKSAAR